MTIIHELIEKINEADKVLIGAGAGLSTSAGFIYTGERFETYFKDFIEKYHFKDMYSGGFYPFESLEEHWAYWSRYIYINRYMNPPKNTYEKLYELVKDKDYFVLTTNVDHCFQKAGFDKSRLFYTQGDYGLFQCSSPCHNKTYDNEDIIKEMVLAQGFEIKNSELIPGDHISMTIPSHLIPTCPKCGEPMSMNLRADNTFVEDDGWHHAKNQYINYLETLDNKKVVLIELGVGFNTPVIIKYPFWRMTKSNKDCTYICLNYNEAAAPQDIMNQSICLNGDIDAILEEIKAIEKES